MNATHKFPWNILQTCWKFTRWKRLFTH